MNVEDRATESAILPPIIKESIAINPVTEDILNRIQKKGRWRGNSLIFGGDNMGKDVVVKRDVNQKPWTP